VPGSIPGGPTNLPNVGEVFLFLALMKDICCYVLWSEKLGKFYIGACQESLQDRIIKHNSGFYEGKNFTKNANDWTLFLKVDAPDYPHAIRLEKKIKSMKSSTSIRNLAKYPEMLIKIYEETNRSTYCPDSYRDSRCLVRSQVGPLTSPMLGRFFYFSHL
jgi:putative endonuclease